jgi:hypothetical protein
MSVSIDPISQLATCDDCGNAWLAIVAPDYAAGCLTRVNIAVDRELEPRANLCVR